MSFASDTKKELCSNTSTDIAVLRSELYAMLLLSKSFSPENIVFKTENHYTANRFIDLCAMLFSPIIERTALPLNKADAHSYTIRIIDSNDCKRIFDFFGHSESDICLRVNRANIEDEECERAFVRGAFLACGSLTNPEKTYHLEFCVQYKNLCGDILRIIGEIQDCEIRPKIVSRCGSYVAYIKDSEQITDLVAFMGASNAAMSIMGTKALKQVRNAANRRTNSEIANIEKVATASASQLKAINKLKKSGRFSSLPDELRAVALLREQYPELSLRDMGEMLTPKITRSGVNHRLKKIIQLSQEEEQ